MKKFINYFLIVSLAFLFSACSQLSTQKVIKDFKVYDAAAFYKTISYSGASISHDGSQILFSSDQTGVFNVYKADFTGGEFTPLTTSTEDAAFVIGWFPNDNRILYSSDQGGNELDHIYVREEDGRVKDITPGEKLKARFAAWSKEGDRFWLSTNERDAKFFDLYVYDSNDYSRSMVFENTGAWQITNISNDGRWLALIKRKNNVDNDIYLVDLEREKSEPQLMTSHAGNIDHAVFTFTPDNQSLIFGTDEHSEFVQAWAYHLESGKKSLFLKEDWDISYIGFSKNGKYRVVGINEDGHTEVSIIETNGGKKVKLPKNLPAGNLLSVSISKDEQRMSFYIDSDTTARNLHSLDLKTGQSNTITKALNSEINEKHLVNSSVVRYKSFDGLDIPGILYKPLSASKENRVPALVWVHGGPGGQSRQGYSSNIQHLVNHGYAVLAANNRGSSGYGKTFYHMDDRKHGEVDLQDIVYARKYLETLEWVDKEKVGIIGGSYGGYMVMAALAFEPKVFDVGVNMFGVTNWVRTLSSIPPWWESQRESLYAELGDPATDAERHHKVSPLFHAKNIVKPVLVVQGANDPRVLQIESDEMVEAVKKNNVPVEYLLFPDEGHGFVKRDNRISFSNTAVKFLNKYLKKAE